MSSARRVSDLAASLGLSSAAIRTSSDLALVAATTSQYSVSLDAEIAGAIDELSEISSDLDAEVAGGGVDHLFEAFTLGAASSPGAAHARGGTPKTAGSDDDSVVLSLPESFDETLHAPDPRGSGAGAGGAMGGYGAGLSSRGAIADARSASAAAAAEASSARADAARLRDEVLTLRERVHDERRLFTPTEIAVGEPLYRQLKAAPKDSLSLLEHIQVVTHERTVDLRAQLADKRKEAAAHLTSRAAHEEAAAALREEGEVRARALARAEQSARAEVKGLEAAHREVKRQLAESHQVRGRDADYSYPVGSAAALRALATALPLLLLLLRRQCRCSACSCDCAPAASTRTLEAVPSPACSSDYA